MEQCDRMLDTYLASEGEAEVVMFSGGEPTIHPRILDFIDLAREKAIRAVTLDTNGIRLAAAPRRGLARAQVASRTTRRWAT